MGCVDTFGGNVEHFADCSSGFEGTIAGALDDGAVADGIGEGDAQLDEVGAASFQGFDEVGRAVRRGIAGRDVGDEAFTVLTFQAGE